MSPVASRWEVPRKSVASGWVRVTSQPAWASSSRSSWFLGVVGGDGLGDEPVDDHGAAGGRGRRAVRRPRSPRPWTTGGSGGRRGGPARPAPPSRATRFHSSGSRWRRSRASAISCAPAEGDMPNANANGSGVNAATSWGAVAAQRLVGQQRRPTGCLDTGVVQWRGGGRPSARRARACGTRRVARPVRLRRRLRARRRGRGRRPRTAPGPSCSWDKSSIDHRHSRPRIPSIHRGFEDGDLFVT